MGHSSNNNLSKQNFELLETCNNSSNNSQSSDSTIDKTKETKTIPAKPLNITQLKSQVLGKASALLPDWDKMNNTEKAYFNHLKLLKDAGEVLDFSFEPVRLKLAPNTFYSPDFRVVKADRTIEFHETKGYWTDDARVKIKIAAQLHPYKFIAVYKKTSKGKSKWTFEHIN